MKQLKCADVSGHSGCQFIAMGDTVDFVKEQLIEHTKNAHPESVGKDGELARLIDQKMTDA